MKKGVIRPRQFQNASRDNDDKLAKFDGESKSAKKQVLIAVAAAAVLALIWMMSQGQGKTDVSVSVSFDSMEDSKQIRGGFDEDDEDDDAGKGMEDDEDDDEEDRIAPAEDEDEEAEEHAPAAHAEEDDEEEDEEIEASSIVPVEPQPANEPEEESFPGHNAQEVKLAKYEKVATPKSALAIESYFLNLGKRSVNISPSGSFKFVLVHARDVQGDGAYIVQGCSYKSKTCKHPDAARIVRTSLMSHGIQAKVLGGGRITRHHLRKSKKAGLISIFGYSRSYGRCEDCNKKACEFIAQAYPDYVVRWSNQGYHESDEYGIKDFVKCSAA